MNTCKVIKLTFRELEERDNTEAIIPLSFTDQKSADETLSMIKEHFELTKCFKLYKDKEKITERIKSVKNNLTWLMTDEEAISYTLMSLYSDDDEKAYDHYKEKVLMSIKDNKSKYEAGYWMDFIKLTDHDNKAVVLLSDWCQYGNIMEKIEIIDLPEDLIKEVELKENIAEIFGVNSEMPVYMTIHV